MRVGQKGDQSTEVRKVAARTCWLTDAGLTHARRWVSIASGSVRVFARVQAPVSSQNAQCSWSSPKSVFVCLFFSSTLSVVLCVSVKKCENPWLEMRKTTRRITGHEWFKEAEIVGSVGGYCHTYTKNSIHQLSPIVLLIFLKSVHIRVKINLVYRSTSCIRCLLIFYPKS